MKLIIDLSKESDKKRLYKVLQALKPVKHVIELKQFRKQRSVRQNAFYWGVVLKLVAAEIGCSIDDAHELMLVQFNPKYVTIPTTGEVVKIPASSTELDTFNWETYIEAIRIWAADFLGCQIPFPHELIEL